MGKEEGGNRKGEIKKGGGNFHVRLPSWWSLVCSKTQRAKRAVNILHVMLG